MCTFFKDLFIFNFCMYMSILLAYMYVYHVCTVPIETRKGCQVPWSWGIQPYVGAGNRTPVLWKCS